MKNSHLLSTGLLSISFGVAPITLSANEIPKSFTAEDGSLVQIEADGTKVVQAPDNATIRIKPDGTKIVSKPDGTSVEVKPNGDKIIKNTDGSSVEVKSGH